MSLRTSHLFLLYVYTRKRERTQHTIVLMKKLLKFSQLDVLHRVRPAPPFRSHFLYNFGCWSEYHVLNREGKRAAPKHEDLQVIEDIWNCMWKQIQRAQSYLNHYYRWCQTSSSEFHFWMVLQGRTKWNRLVSREWVFGDNSGWTSGDTTSTVICLSTRKGFVP